MMGRQDRDQGQLFYEFNGRGDCKEPPAAADERVRDRPLADLHEQLKPFLQRDRPPVGRSGTHDPDAYRWLLLRHPL
jgi:hypothetical protein